MVRKMLNNLSDLRQSGFGRPSPRHGLNLLWWFAHDCVQIDSNGRMTALCDPTKGDFGFRWFHNREGLLPYSDLLYYEVGNLHKADSLPEYVTRRYTGDLDGSNTDRIIVSFNPVWRRFESVYVTQHSDQVHFDQNRTYRISPDLIKDIKDLSRKDFLRRLTRRSGQVSIDMPQTVWTNTSPNVSNELNASDSGGSQQLPISRPRSVQHSRTNPCQSWKCRCALIGCGLMVLLIAGVAIYIWSKTK
ncbi:uncharacterized protein LOC122341118 [Puntigrus tetrazona]|uniref:uncharacterized protein LOC122341118 n=1 Tax=Puntigrus tetrazona TaxID=1606681 RepID=UPI001C8A9DAC|nr:uncharacterized protein LOC122341118 [Puntigrus tetrazona]